LFSIFHREIKEKKKNEEVEENMKGKKIEVYIYRSEYFIT